MIEEVPFEANMYAIKQNGIVCSSAFMWALVAFFNESFPPSPRPTFSLNLILEIFAASKVIHKTKMVTTYV